MKRIVLLGASGSIGRQTIDIIQQHPDEFMLVAFGVGKNIAQAKVYLDAFPSIDTISVQDEEDAVTLRTQYPSVTILSGQEGLIHLVERKDNDVCVNALVGFAGFIPTLKAIENGKDVALANKETLVCGGKLITQACRKYGTKLFPIDSEHSAIWQCLRGNDTKQIKKLLVTCSGGAFRNLSREELATVTPAMALAHPNWNMGPKITIDCADLMNKGFEVIEAHWLFDIPYEQIEVVMHPQSIVHSAVEYIDHSVIAQMGAPDMRLPIQYALTYPDRYSYHQDQPFDLSLVSTLHFEKPDTQRFPLLKLAYEAGKKGGNLCAVMNGANEVANLAFRKEEIPFLMIEEIISSALQEVEFKELETVEDVIEADRWARDYAHKRIKEYR